MIEYYQYAFCQVCLHSRRHFKGECLVCLLHEDVLERQRQAHPEVDPDQINLDISGDE